MSVEKLAGVIVLIAAAVYLERRLAAMETRAIAREGRMLRDYERMMAAINGTAKGKVR